MSPDAQTRTNEAKITALLHTPINDEYNENYLCLLASQGDLGGHHALSLGDQRALGAAAVAPATVAFMALKGRNHAVVAATGAFRCPLVALRRPEKECSGGGRRRRRNTVVMLRVHGEKARRIHHGAAGAGSGGGGCRHGLGVLPVGRPV